MRIQRILVGAALLMLCAAAAYADVQVSSIPVTTSISTGRAEQAGTVRLTAMGVAGAVPDVITVRYGGLPITIAPSPTGVQVDPASTWAGCAIVPPVDYVNGIITVNCPNAAATGLWFSLIGVRLSVDGYAGTSVHATIGTLFNPIIAGQNSTAVINSIAPGLSAAATGTTLSYMSNGTPIVATSSWVLTEGFNSAWAETALAGTGALNGTDITITVSGLASNVSLTAAAVCSGSALSACSVVAPATLTSTVTQVKIVFTGTDASVIEKATVSFTPVWGAVPYGITSYTAYATLSPNKNALTSGGVPADTGFYPKFALVNLPTAGFTVLSIASNATNFIIPYMTTALGYDTGIAIANTTTDPFAVGSAPKQDGAVTVTFYGNDGTIVTYNSATDTTKGTGLTAGVLKTGYTWTVLASELLAAKGRTTPLTGYAIVVLGATNGHGAAYVSNFAGFTSGSPLLVLDNPVVSARSALTAGAERTSH